MEKVLVSIEKSILPLYDMHIIVLIASEIRENCRPLDNSVLNLFRKAVMPDCRGVGESRIIQRVRKKVPLRDLSLSRASQP